ncbi:hypothetical protein P154DRAFT_439908 [Amniculicola lignicola CBS 123094]|uniref:Methyltransferase-domain-containing protein n=1 Tax=Amniculicola lignicola CBS 123094 TaxID=1392246 RepID=A0A6A5WFV0_9PLEO|nr:hypothetical protein P154DRAFT_439908 [Amniculicola lignicola CBS 123094]
MRYIRYLKPPRITNAQKPAQAQISFLTTITSDLGDSFLPYDLALTVYLCNAREPHKNIYIQHDVQWTAGMRALSTSFYLSKARSNIEWPCRIYVGVKNMELLSPNYTQMYMPERRGVIGAWSAPLDMTEGLVEAARIVERRIPLGKNGYELKIWEETGESIARHLWDAGVLLSLYLSEDEDLSKRDPVLAKAIKRPTGKKRLQILELGTGCGVVGITLAQTIVKCECVLTDLPDAEEAVKRNLSTSWADTGSGVWFRQLDWDDESVPKMSDLNNWTDCPHCNEFDLIVAADCTYNADSCPALVRTISRLVKLSPRATVMIAMKPRHSSEGIFFDLMSDAGFRTEHKTTLQLPGDDEVGEESVEIFLFRPDASQELTSIEPNEWCFGIPVKRKKRKAQVIE